MQAADRTGLKLLAADPTELLPAWQGAVVFSQVYSD